MVNLEKFAQYTTHTNVSGSFSNAGEFVMITFDNSNLVDGALVLNHLRDVSLVIPEALFNEDGILQDQSGIFQIVDANTCKYTFGGPLEDGRYLFVFKFLYL